MKKFIRNLKSVFKRPQVWGLILIILASILASRTLFEHNFYFNMHDDLQMMRQLELEKCFKDMQIPCRWVPDMGYGYGLPLFNYYPQLPYLFGEVFRLVGFPFNDVAKLTFALGIIASGLTMYLLAKEFFGRLGGIFSSIFYIWAPYRALDVYVRGAMNESWAWIWFPLILWGIYKLIKFNKTGHLITLSLAIAALLLTHNPMLMIFFPVAIVWAIFWLIKEKAFKLLPKLIIAGVLALGLGAFFTLPAIFEQKYVHIDSLTSDYFVFAGHFATVNQLFISNFWGDGPSTFGPVDGMAFPIGQVHWAIALFVALMLVVKIIKTKKIENTDWLAFFGIVIGTGAAFMAHERSTFLWKLIPALKFIQFPWRFLSLNVLGYSIAVGSIFWYLKSVFQSKKSVWKYILFLAGVTSVIFFNWTYFAPVHSGPLTDEQKLSGEAWRIQKQAGIRDYLPIDAAVDPNSAMVTIAEVFQGKGIITSESQGTDWAKFEADLSADKNTVRVNIFNYPIWRAYVDGKEIPVYVDTNEKWGRIYLDVPKGNHDIYLKLTNTPLRTFANYLSLTSWVILLTYPVWKKKLFNGKLA
jgi:hypothetical protein